MIDRFYTPWSGREGWKEDILYPSAWPDLRIRIKQLDIVLNCRTVLSVDCLSIFPPVCTLYNWTIIWHCIVTGDCSFFRSFASSKSFGMPMLDFVVPPPTHTHTLMLCCNSFSLSITLLYKLSWYTWWRTTELFSNTGIAVSSHFFRSALYIPMLQTCHVLRHVALSQLFHIL
jgi:hypothetical protein